MYPKCYLNYYRSIGSLLLGWYWDWRPDFRGLLGNWYFYFTHHSSHFLCRKPWSWSHTQVYKKNQKTLYLQVVENRTVELTFVLFVCLFSFLQDYLISCQQRMESLLNKSLTPHPTLQIPAKHSPMEEGNDKPLTPTDVEGVSKMIEAEAHHHHTHAQSSWWR